MVTKFQKKVYSKTKKIPKGKVSTYKEIAKSLNSKAYRAVGQALKVNKHPDIIPCYKVIKDDGSIGGYSGSDPKNIRRKINKLRADGIIVRNNKIDLLRYKHVFKK